MSGDENIIGITIEIGRVKAQREDWAAATCHLDTVQLEGANIPRWMHEASDGRGISIAGVFGPKLAHGDLFDVEVREVNDPKWGRQLKVIRAMPCARRDERAIYSFLRRLPHIGPQRATEVIRTFGDADAIFEILEKTPERLAEVKGITPNRAVEIAENFVQLAGVRDAWVFCRSLGVKPRLAARIMDMLRSSARAVITADPFSLMRTLRVTFQDCDALRVKLGWPEDHPLRLAAASYALFQAAAKDGHVFHREEDLFGADRSRAVTKVANSLGVSEDLMKQGLAQLTLPVEVEETGVSIPPRIAEVDGRYYLAEHYEAEQTICRAVRELLG